MTGQGRGISVAVGRKINPAATFSIDWSGDILVRGRPTSNALQ